ncbi:hypothetical protein BKI52_37795 [marine bacterium AO1-C]|nr:hypothetical protein BKI52_37795 [marine bacterium AO1-C]
MNKRPFVMLFLGSLLALAGCSQKGPGEGENVQIPLNSDSFTNSMSQGKLQNDKIDEASGLVASRSNSKAYWTHNDSGGKSKLFLVDDTGKDLGVFTLKGIKARDWEDIALGPGPKDGVNYLYVGEIGDNKAKYDEKMIYRIPEPDVSEVQTPVKQKIKKDQIETIRFKYPDGKRDAEALMIDPTTKDIYIVTKREDGVRVYVARYPQSTQEVNTLERVGTLDLHKIVAGDISPDGKEVLLKDYGNIYYWKKSGDESIEELLKTAPMRLPYIPEPQGESIAWKLDGSGFFTLSEERGGVEAELYLYKRK